MGTVTFNDGSAILCAAVALVGNQATCDGSSLNVAGSPHSVTAVYSGASGPPSFVTSTSPSLFQTVAKATLVVDANDKSRDYGDPNPAFDATISGFKNSETLATSGVAGSPLCSSTATATSPVSGSPYPITCALGSLTAGNYTFTFTPGELTVAKATLVVDANDKSRDYDEFRPGLRRDHLGLQEQRDPRHHRGGRRPLCIHDDRHQPGDGQPLPDYLRHRQPDRRQLHFTFTPGALNVTKATLAVAANNKTRDYGDPNPAFAATIQASRTARPSPPPASRAARLQFHGDRHQPGVGSPYPITSALGSLTAGNYTFSFMHGKDVTKATLAVDANDQTRDYA